MTKLFCYIFLLLPVFASGQQYITGGTEIDITEATWQILLMQGTSYACGGSINVSNIPDGLYSLIVTKNNTLLHSETILIQH